MRDFPASFEQWADATKWEAAQINRAGSLLTRCILPLRIGEPLTRFSLVDPDWREGGTPNIQYWQVGDSFAWKLYWVWDSASSLYRGGGEWLLADSVLANIPAVLGSPS